MCFMALLLVMICNCTRKITSDFLSFLCHLSSQYCHEIYHSVGGMLAPVTRTDNIFNLVPAVSVLLNDGFVKHEIFCHL